MVEKTNGIKPITPQTTALRRIDFIIEHLKEVRAYIAEGMPAHIAIALCPKPAPALNGFMMLEQQVSIFRDQVTKQATAPKSNSIPNPK